MFSHIIEMSYDSEGHKPTLVLVFLRNIYYSLRKKIYGKILDLPQTFWNIEQK
jgi:hypothetical protein